MLQRPGLGQGTRSRNAYREGENVEFTKEEWEVIAVYSPFHILPEFWAGFETITEIPGLCPYEDRDYRGIAWRSGKRAGDVIRRKRLYKLFGL